MFDKLRQGKQILQARQQAAQLKKKFEQVEHVEEENGVRVKVNGAQEVLWVEIDGQERSDLVKIINKAMREVQKKVAKKLMDEGGGLGSLLGGLG